MGLFTKKVCPICNNQVKGVLNVVIKDRIQLCSDCSKKVDMDLPMLPLQTLDNIKEHLSFREENQLVFQNFNTTYEVNCGGVWFREDANLKKWYFSFEKQPVNPTLFDYNDVIDYAITENGETISKGGLGSAVAGGILFGGVGAIAGGIVGKKKNKQVIQSMQLRISFNHKYRKQYLLNIIPGGSNIKANSFTYNSYKSQANNVSSFLDNIINQGKLNQQFVTTQQISGADEILKYKELLDGGIITREEFEIKKRQLLEMN